MFVAEALNQIFVAILVFLRCMDIAAREGKKSYDEERYLAIQLVFTSYAWFFFLLLNFVQTILMSWQRHVLLLWWQGKTIGTLNWNKTWTGLLKYCIRFVRMHAGAQETCSNTPPSAHFISVVVTQWWNYDYFGKVRIPGDSYTCYINFFHILNNVNYYITENWTYM